ncbi:TolC family protein [Mariniblastus fucicola]|uniref:Outer membrane efflux protein n=1 Tax=Mariniblastus fucicola TaxID=980251 RepID=A0A5B9P7S4_9BACT|nr:TolC family protein [Mariniblastus fucicola]QEG22394.1 Outer membrane efflux protein [Mariniblastus fucicola]
MRPTPKNCLAWITAVTVLMAGCTPSKPVYVNDTGALDYYVDQATSIEYPDVSVPSLEEVNSSRPPITVTDPDFDSFVDMTLEDCVSAALQNGKLFRGYGTPALQGTRVLPGQDTVINAPNAVGTIYNIAIRETEPGAIGTPGQLSLPGSILTNTQLDSNQGVEAALSQFDAQLTSSLNYTKSDEPRNTIPTNPNQPLVFQQDQVQWQTEIAKEAANGTQLFFRNVNVYTANSNPVDDPLTPNDVEGFQVLDSFYRASFEAEVRQPLLRGRGAFINRMPIVISRIGTDQEIANLEAQLQNFVTNVEIRYWELYSAYRSLEAAKTGRDAALQTYRIVKDQFDERSSVNRQQVAQASEQYWFFDAQVTEAFDTLLKAEGQLRFLLGWAANDGRMIRPIDEPLFAPVEFDYCTTVCEAMTYRPELRSIRWEIRKRELAVAYAKNGLLPEMNVTALYRFLGLGNKYGTSDAGTQYPDPGSGVLNELYDGNYQELQLGVDFRMPVGFRAELSNVRNSQLKLAREIAKLEDSELDVNKEIHETLQSMAASLRTATSHFNRWRSSKIEKDVFDELRNAGVETLDVALDAQRRLSQAEIAFYQSITEYNKMLALLHRRKGTTLAYCGISFEEGPWPGKAYMDASEYARRRGASREMNYGWSRPEVISRGEDFPSNSNIGRKTGETMSYSYDGNVSGGVQTVPYNQPVYGSPAMLQGDGMIPANVDSMHPVLESAPELIPMSNTTQPESDVQVVSYEEPVVKQPTTQIRNIQRRKLRARTQSTSDIRSEQTLSAVPAVHSAESTTKRIPKLKKSNSSATTNIDDDSIPVNPVRMNWAKVGANSTRTSSTSTSSTVGRIVTKDIGDN